MVTVKYLTISVTYRVSVDNIEMAEEVREQLIEAAENFDEISIETESMYPDAYNWVIDKIKEGDCYDWVADVININ